MVFFIFSYKQLNNKQHFEFYFLFVDYRLSTLARRLKANSESLVRIFCFVDPTTLWHKIICSSIGNLLAMTKNLPAGVWASVSLIARRSSHRKTTRAKTRDASEPASPSSARSSHWVCRGRIGSKSLQQRCDIRKVNVSGNLKESFPISSVSCSFLIHVQVLSTQRNQPFQSLQFVPINCFEERNVSTDIGSEVHIYTRIFTKQANNFNFPVFTGTRQGCRAFLAIQGVDINLWVSKENLHNFMVSL